MNFRERVKLMKKISKCQRRIEELNLARIRAKNACLKMMSHLKDFDKHDHTIGGAEWN